jgi:FO synthase
MSRMPSRVTFSRNVTLSLSRTCQCFCKYCAFATHQAHLHEPEEVLGILDHAARRNVKELLVLTGEKPEVNKGVRARLDALGFPDFTGYVAWVCERALERGLLPHTNLGVLSHEDLGRLREVTASQGLMLESIRPDLVVHQGSPTKDPAVRLACLRDAGALRIPFTTGILVGIGETEADRMAALEALAAVHAEFGHLQEVILQNYVPHRRYHGEEPADIATAAAEAFWRTGIGSPPHLDRPAWASEVGIEDMRRLIAEARRLMPGVGIQVPPNLADWWPELVAAGATDLGGLSANGDHISPEHPFPSPHQVRRTLAADGHALTERLCVYPQYIDPEWVAQPVLDVIKTRFWSFIPRRGLGPARRPADPPRPRPGGDRPRPRGPRAVGGRAHRPVRRDPPGGHRRPARGRGRAARRARGRRGDLRRQPQHQRLQHLHRRLRVLRLRAGQALPRRLRARPRGLRAPGPGGGGLRRHGAVHPVRDPPRLGPRGLPGLAAPGQETAPGPAPARLLGDGDRAHVRRHRAAARGGLRAPARRRPGLHAGHRGEVLHDGVRERISPNKLPVARWVEIIEASHRAACAPPPR